MQKLKGKKFMIHGEQLHLSGVASFSDEVDGDHGLEDHRQERRESS